MAACVLGTQRGYNDGMKETAEGVARAFVRAINRHDVEAMGALMTPEHRSVDSLGKVVEGRENVQAVWVGYLHMIPDYQIAVEERICGGPVVVMLGVAKGTYTTDGWLRAENGWEMPAAFRALIKDGKVEEWRVYADNEPMRERVRKSK